MKVRIISGVIGAIALIVFTYLGHLWLAAGMGLIIALGAWEYQKLSQSMGHDLPLPLIVGGSLVYLLFAAFKPPYPWLLSFPGSAGLIVTGLLFVLLLMELVQEETETALVKTGLSLLGLVYPGLLLSYIILIRQFPEPYGFHLLIFAYIIAFGSDTGAYFVGTLTGRCKLAPRISPKKSVEGAAGGIVVGSLAGIIYLYCVGMLAGPWIIIALFGTVLAQLGDLFESLLKRGANIKDSGQFLPGHGGVLDRFDSLTFVAPFVYYMALFILRR